VRVREAKHELRPTDEALIVFVHIPKTGGASVKSMFAHACPRGTVIDAGNYMRGPERAIARISSGRIARGRVAVGHIPYGLFHAHLPGDTRYLTVLRDPVERVLSYYHGHIRRTPRTERAGVVTAESLQDAIDLRLPELTNLATRLLCGEVSPMDELPANALGRAKANLREFEFVGITERFNESIVLMQHVLGLPSAVYERQHVSKGRPSAEQVPENQRRLITETNSLDMELYEFACRLFDERVRADKGDLADDAARLGGRTDTADARARTKLRDAVSWLEPQLPPGAQKPVVPLRQAAEEAGISEPSLRRAAKRLDAHVEREPSGERRWVRPP
jgi:hypothetical protein